MRALLLRISVIFFAAALGVWILLYSDRVLQEHFSYDQQFRNKLQSLRSDIFALKSELLQNSSFLYHSYDRIQNLSNKIEALIQELKSCDILKNHSFSKSKKGVEELSKRFDLYIDMMERFLTLNSSLKNSALYLPTLQIRALMLFDASKPKDRETLKLISQINASLFLAKNALDLDFISKIKELATKLEKLDEYHGARKELLGLIKRHIEIFLNYFPDYVHSLKQLLHNNLDRDISRLLKTFQDENSEVMRKINQLSRWLLILYLLSLIVILSLLFKTYKENINLRKLKEELERSLITDSLTGVGNRLAYQKEIAKLDDPLLLLINIDNFKHINEFYGSKIGDKVLIELARQLRLIITKDRLRANLFRLGGDDFGILMQKRNLSIPLERFLENYRELLDRSRIHIDDLTVDLSFSVGASAEKEWLFETADMALKAAKRSKRGRFTIYTPSLDKREEIERNINTLKKIRCAIEQNSIHPYFQPIFDLSSKQITKYEALARIELEGGEEVLQPYNFIKAASEAKLSNRITLKIFEETLKIATKYPYDFSINIASSDISDPQSRKSILQTLRGYPDLGKRIIFEILESEEIDDYQSTCEFIRALKRMGCRVAIDDFGSGYSNFERVFNLDIDILKVDGSLIKRIDSDKNLELIAKTIIDFARRANIQTVAEFVHSEQIYEKVAKLGFDFAQGYYIGEPIKEIGKKYDIEPI